MEIIDAFNFFNELDLLEIRLNILFAYVDKFVLVESRLTHSGIEKPLYYQENKERFAQWNDKIVHYVVDTPLEWHELPQDHPARTSPKLPKYTTAFMRDFYEKEAVKDALEFAKDDDIVFVSDLDEIWNPLIKFSIYRDIPFMYRPKQLAYSYYLNLRTNEEENWTGTIITDYKTIKRYCLNHLRAKEMTPSIPIENGGWHFTNMGGIEAVKKKLESYSHQEYNVEEIKDNLETAMKNGTDFIGRDYQMWVDESDWPEYLAQNKGKYLHLLK